MLRTWTKVSKQILCFVAEPTNQIQQDQILVQWESVFTNIIWLNSLDLGDNGWAISGQLLKLQEFIDEGGINIPGEGGGEATNMTTIKIDR